MNTLFRLKFIWRAKKPSFLLLSRRELSSAVGSFREENILRQKISLPERNFDGKSISSSSLTHLHKHIPQFKCSLKDFSLSFRRKLRLLPPLASSFVFIDFLGEREKVKREIFDVEQQSFYYNETFLPLLWLCLCLFACVVCLIWFTKWRVHTLLRDAGGGGEGWEQIKGAKIVNFTVSLSHRAVCRS